MTGAANGRVFYEGVSQTVERCLRAGQPLSLAYLDLDNFKWLNDNRGHAAGDEALCDLVRTIQQSIRVTDQLARLGGDEFALLLPECGDADAVVVLERIQERFAHLMDGKKWPVTMSIGLSTFPQPMRDVDAMVRRVDELTERELDVFRLIARGHSNAEIGGELYISETTVKTHITHILQKLDLRDRVQAVVLAHEAGLFDADAQPPAA